ncbi:sugar ABC transporter ATP-binding protein [Homoserinibacter sp. YIM 151385]|uniref:sugar ABC transporter ATP-binding protein n=1 Tax=Homoserinibacter sp. YIM 151385 TaxID=2985506 RepID=UPI0022F08143|nr:sugar ABC transporter ATP-binding protein [Homoserinibacter sp. YIM 151385]WBU39252.1 sugar ABC transporter ATP-binding protein [Homoserinibacter sp. YIM 151385]
MTVEVEPRTVVRLRGIVKSFAGTTVVDGVDLDLLAGRVHVLAGENGAGKSTLMKVLAGIHAPDAGTVEVSGRAVGGGVRAAQEAGVALVHQELLMAPNLTVADNLAMGREHRGPLGVLDRRRTRRLAREQLDRVGARFSELERVERLSTGQQQLIEIARALATDPQVLIFDEPTAALSARETANLFRIVRELREAGTAIVYITHRMDEIEELADTVTVLRDGRLVETLDAETATPEAIVTRMVGRPIETLFADSARTPGATVLEVEGLGDGDGIGPCDLRVRAGEIVGIAGLVGSGRSEFARLVFGADRHASGRVSVDGRRVDAQSPRAAVRSRIALVPESRKDQGLVLGRSIADNIIMASFRRVARGGVIRRRAVADAAAAERERLGIRGGAADRAVRELSGGNQQKVLLAKWLQTDPRVLILDEPTRGVDVGAKADIYRIIDDCAARGMAIVVISSELPELLGLADRIVVMRRGAFVADLDNTDLTEETVMEHAFGLADGSATASIPTAEEARR